MVHHQPDGLHPVLDLLARRGDLMDKHIRAMRLRNQVFVIARVMAVNKDAARIFDPERIGDVDEIAVINLDGADHETALIIDDAFGIFMRDDPHMFGVDLVVGDTDVAVRPGGDPGPLGDAVDAGRAMNMKRPVPATELLPDRAGHGHVEQAGIMV